MKQTNIEHIPISQIRIVNPRTRSKTRFNDVVDSIRTVGLKRPITVCRRNEGSDVPQYDLVCGQGRMEACLALGNTSIPAIIVEATQQEQFLMSLVENLARRPPSNHDLFREVRSLRARQYTEEDIARKLGLSLHYTSGIVRLAETGERSLIEAVEGKRLPISVAVEIANDDNHEVQRALSQAYEKGDLRGTKLRTARRLIAQRIARRRKLRKALPSARKLTGAKIVKEYRREIRNQRDLASKAATTKDRLLLLVSALRCLFGDEHFVTLLRAEQLVDMPKQLADHLQLDGVLL